MIRLSSKPREACAVALLLVTLTGLASCGSGSHEIAAAQTAKPAPEPAPLPPDASAQAKLIDAYLRLTVRLASDDDKGAKAAAGKLGQAAAAVAGEQAAQMKSAAADIAAATDIAAQRVAFERASTAAIALVETAGNPLPTILYVARCPMAFDNRGARWLQSSKPLFNPYFGASMLTCGSVDAQYAPGARKP